MSDYDFDDCVSIANRPDKNLQGYVKSKLVDISLTNIEIKKPRSKNNPEDDVVQTVFKFSFIVKGKKEDIKMSRITGTKISTDVRHIKGKGRGTGEIHEYNALTQICLNLGIFKKEDIVDDKEELLIKSLKKAVESVNEENSIYLKSKLETSEKSNDFENISISSIQLIDKF